MNYKYLDITQEIDIFGRLLLQGLLGFDTNTTISMNTDLILSVSLYIFQCNRCVFAIYIVILMVGT